MKLLIKSLLIGYLCFALSACGLPSSIDEAVRVIDNGIEAIRTGSANWQTVLQRVADELPKDISTEIRTDAQNLATRSIALTGVEFRCGIADFLQKRAIRNLQYLKAKLLKQNPPLQPPEFCQVSPPSISLSDPPNNWETVILTGYDLDYKDGSGKPFQFLLVNAGGQTTSIPEIQIGRTTHYQVTLNIRTMARALYSGGIGKIVVLWDNAIKNDAGQVVVIPWSPQRRTEYRNPGSLSCQPPKVAGDADFSTGQGNPADIALRAWIANTGQRIVGNVFFQARERGGDNTTVSGTCDGLLYSAPENWKIISVRPSDPSPVDDLLKVPMTTGQMLFPRPAGEVAESFYVYLDRAGDEAGIWTRVEVRWRQLEAEIEEQVPTWLQ